MNTGSKWILIFAALHIVWSEFGISSLNPWTQTALCEQGCWLWCGLPPVITLSHSFGTLQNLFGHVLNPDYSPNYQKNNWCYIIF